ncbi:putative reverse transcriptase domain-containing protein [Tanacetum coccineum]
MTTVDPGMSVEEIERVVAQRVANAIEAIAIYETKANMARKSISQTEQQECKLAENANNKRKLAKLTLCNKVGHLVRNYRRPTNDNTTNNQKGTGTSQKVNCYECGNQRHYRRDCPERKNQSHKNQIGGTGAHGEH